MFDFYKYLLLFMVNLSVAITIFTCKDFRYPGIYELDKATINEREGYEIKISVTRPPKELNYNFTDEEDSINYALEGTINFKYMDEEDFTEYDHEDESKNNQIKFEYCTEKKSVGIPKVFFTNELEKDMVSFKIDITNSDLSNYIQARKTSKISIEKPYGDSSKKEPYGKKRVSSYESDGNQESKHTENKSDSDMHDYATDIGAHSSEAKQNIPTKSLNFTDISSQFTLRDNTTVDLDKWIPLKNTISKLVTYTAYFEDGQEKTGYGVLKKNSLFIFFPYQKFIKKIKLYFNKLNFMLQNFRDLHTLTTFLKDKAQRIEFLPDQKVSDLLKHDKNQPENFLTNYYKINEIINNEGKGKFSDFYFLVFGDVKKHFVGIKSFRKLNALSLLLIGSVSSVSLTLDADINNDLITLGMIVLICDNLKTANDCVYLGEVVDINKFNGRLLIKVNFLTTIMVMQYKPNYTADVTLDLDSDSRMISSQVHNDNPPNTKRLKTDQ